MNWYCWILLLPHEGRGTMLHIVQDIAKHIFIPFTVGGGVRTVEDINALLRAGADKVSGEYCGMEKSAVNP